MGGQGSGLNRANPNGQFCDEIEASVFALKDAQAKFEAAERLEEEAEGEMRQSLSTLQAVLRRAGYRHLLREDEISIEESA